MGFDIVVVYWRKYLKEKFYVGVVVEMLCCFYVVVSVFFFVDYFSFFVGWILVLFVGGDFLLLERWND